MAARRLLTVLIVLLVLSSVAAALVPIERANEESSTTTTSTATIANPGSSHHATVDAWARRPETIKLETGDQLALAVRSHRPAQINIPGFGELADTDPAFAAHFDLLAFRPGRYRVRLLEEGEPARTIAVIAVAGPVGRAS
jgi:hypothetical protein